jgi:hypothetical protein
VATPELWPSADPEMSLVLRDHLSRAEPCPGRALLLAASLQRSRRPVLPIPTAGLVNLVSNGIDGLVLRWESAGLVNLVFQDQARQGKPGHPAAWMRGPPGSTWSAHRWARGSGSATSERWPRAQPDARLRNPVSKATMLLWWQPAGELVL